VTTKTIPPEHRIGATTDVLLFRVGGEEYGFPLDHLCEVVEIVEIKRIDDEAAGSVVGIIDYRGAVIPVVDTRRVLRLSPADYDLTARIIITDAGGDATGLMVDEVHDVRSVFEDAIEQPGPSVPLRRYVSGIARLGDRLLLILNIEKMVAAQRGLVRRASGPTPTAELVSASSPLWIDELRRRAAELSKPVAQEGGPAGETFTVVGFALGEGIYGLAVEHVTEIVASPRISPIPCTPEHILGAVNIRGQITPVVSLEQLIGLVAGRVGPDEEIRLIVVEMAGVMVAVHVDAVVGIWDVANADVMPPTGVVDGEGAGFVEGEIVQDDRRVCLLDATAVVDAAIRRGRIETREAS